MSNRVVQAVELLDDLVGSHTAHLSTTEQIEVALELARRCMDMVSELVQHEMVEVQP